MRKRLIALLCWLSSAGLFAQDQSVQSNPLAETAETATFLSAPSAASVNPSRARHAHLQSVQNIEAILRDNGPLVTHPGQGLNGANASVVTTGATFGFAHSPSAAIRVADDFTVPDGEQWTLDSVWLYAYQTGSPGTTSTITSVNARIWKGQPGQAGSTIVFGDTTTNRMIGTRFSNIYRVQDASALTNAQRPIMIQTVNLGGITLSPGTYWLDWQTGGSLASGPFVPPVSIIGQPVVPGANALQRNAAGVWTNLQDGANPVELPFALHGISTAPIFGASPTSVNFGSVAVNASSAPRTITLGNVSGGVLTITGVSLTGADASQFTLTNTNALPANLGQFQTISVSVTFSPTSAGAKNASLQVTYAGAPGSPATIPLSGTGFVPAQVAILLDNNSANMRASRDTLIAYLNAQGITRDVIHWGGAIPSLSIYQIVFLLGEGESPANLATRNALKTYLQNGAPASKARLIVFSEDFGYNHDRAGAFDLDTMLTRELCGVQYLRDSPTGNIGGERVVNVGFGIADSVTGSYPDVFRRARPNTTVLYRFQRYALGSDSVSAIGRNEAGYATAVFGFDLRRYRAAFDTPPVAGENVSSAMTRLLNSAIHFVQTGQALPVELTSFTAEVRDGAAHLAWTTASELNNAGFEAQRRSANRGAGSEWQVLGFARGAGTTTQAQSYSFVDRTASGRVQYRLKQIDYDGRFEYSPVIEVDAGLPKSFALEQNYPNPFNPTTTIQFALPTASDVTLEVFNVLGQKVATLVNRRMEAGMRHVQFNAAGLASGIYFYRLQAGNFVATKKMTLAK